MSDQTFSEPNTPGFRSRNPELIPKALLRAMFALAMASLLIVSFSVYSGRDHVGQPLASEPVAQTRLILQGGGAKAVTVRDANGDVMADLAHGGFITVVQNGLETERRKHGVDPMLPVTLVRYANGRLTIIDPETNWSVELGSFGADNKAAFERLLTN
jgi:putative photosynthetic complex assembly protein